MECFLEYSSGNLLKDCHWWNLRSFSFLHCRYPCNKIHLLRLPELRALYDLVAEVDDEEKRNVDIRDEEV